MTSQFLTAHTVIIGGRTYGVKPILLEGEECISEETMIQRALELGVSFNYEEASLFHAELPWDFVKADDRARDYPYHHVTFAQWGKIVGPQIVCLRFGHFQEPHSMRGKQAVRGWYMGDLFLCPIV